MDQFSVGLTVQAMIDVQSKSKDSQRFQTDMVTEGSTRVDKVWTQSGITGLSRSIGGDGQVNWFVELPLMYHLDSAWDISLVPYYSWRKAKVKDYTYDIPETSVILPDGVTQVTFSGSANENFNQKMQDLGARLEFGYRF